MKKISSLFIFLFLCSFTEAHSNYQMSIATLNTWMIPVLRKKANERASFIGEALAQYDGAFFQEVFSKKQKRIFKRKLSDFDSYEDRRPLGKITSGLLSFSRFPIIEKKFIRYRKCKLAQCFANKGVLLTRVKISENVELDVYNTHTEPFSDRAWIRERQIKQLLAFVESNDPLKMNPAIILGDLNIHSETEEYVVINSLLEQVGFRDSWVEVNGNDPGFTWNSILNEWGQRLHRKPQNRTKERLDYIYVRDGVHSQIALDEVELILDQKVKLRPNDGVTHFVSDHFGVGAKLTLY